MPSHYFDESPGTPHSLRAFTEDLAGKNFRFISDSSTFSRKRLDFGSRQLIEAALDLEDFPAHGEVLDLGCGWGPVGIILKSFFPEIRLSFCDINERALRQANENFKNNCRQAEAQFFLSDGLSQVPYNFDLILLNPPIRAGNKVVYRLYQEAYDSLYPGGRLLIVVQKNQGAMSSKQVLEEIFGRGAVKDIARKSGFHVYSAQKTANEEF